jgi:hypothetical protein
MVRRICQMRDGEGEAEHLAALLDWINGRTLQ